MDQKNQSQSISDDQELAKVLAGVSQGADSPNPIDDHQSIQDVQAPQINPPVQPDATQPDEVAPVQPTVAGGRGDNDDIANSALDNIKQDALLELRPLIGKLNVSPEEKFDTYLLLIRSTDDKDLIAPAHEAARNIVDESKKAQALLDIIKEIDFLSNRAD